MSLPLVRLARLGALVILALILAAPASPASAIAATATDPAWRGQYFANQDLSGNPAVVRSDANLAFNWGWGAPASGLPADHFSARWTRNVYFTQGQYRFSASVDDGIRVYVDGKTIIDQWRVTAPITYTSSIALDAGTHALRVEYFENTERAQIHVWWDQEWEIQVNSAIWQPPVHPGTWQGTYYKNRSLSGDPAFKRDDAFVYFDWGTAGPGGGLPGTEFSVRWYRVVDFPQGRYLFKVFADDGVRVWLDWKTIVDEWHDSPGQTYAVERDVQGGSHEMVVEYYQGIGGAQVKLEWQDANVDWIGNLSTCLRPWDSWIKVYRLGAHNVWEDLKSAGWGPIAKDGALTLFGLPVSALYGWNGQPYKVELWESGRLVRAEGDVFAGQKPLLLQPRGLVQTTWPCGANIPQ
jgi:hypothetical protein